MKMKLPPMVSEMSTAKKIWSAIGVIVLILVVLGLTRGKNNAANIQTDTVKKQNVKLTVLSTAQVVSSTDLSLSFKTSGIVQRVNVKEGNKVKVGQILATLSQGDQAASLTQARGSLASAQANLQRVLAGASNEEVAVAQSGVDSAKINLDNAKKNLADTIAQQKTLVDNAQKALFNSTFIAQSLNSNLGSAPTVSGTYTGTTSGSYKISFYGTGNGLYYSVQGLESASGPINGSALAPLGNRGLYLQFPTNSAASDVWVVEVPNTRATNYVTNLNAYNSAIQSQQSATTAAQNAILSAQSALDQATATLNLKKSQARPADVAAANAQITSAQGQVQAANAQLENTIIRAPAAGTITSVDIKVGELAAALKEAIILQDVENLHVEANISEANIAQVKADQVVDITFDALGPDRHFQGKVQSINPGATVVSGVVNYKVIVGVENAKDIKPGMTANMIIIIAQKDGVLTIPQRSIVTAGDKKTIRVIDDPVKKTYHEVDVQTGLVADGGVVEITSGLTEGQTIVTYIKP